MRQPRQIQLSRKALFGAVLSSTLLFSTGAWAGGKITGRDVKNGSLTGRDVKNHSLTPADFKGSVRGPVGPPGQPGIAQTRVVSNSQNNTVGRSSINCSPNERLLSASGKVQGGGFFDGVQLGADGRSAVASGSGDGSGNGWEVTVYAVCAQIGSGS